ncbi:hypothetical protein BESB_069460 [Besnoitia besnoiti]|uniref:Calpain catalytic domain-containing protein n=1 Tax=Besnoitia besnoiti TaxID=94643 RepID=A0A2A9MGX3_BESBE|nr:hypothetical protein BESB_069460 [Besnoitia besnoiti]PFH34913.1 hypothetical protein BESB_069460 [Besnoitia besnoiti]
MLDFFRCCGVVGFRFHGALGEWKHLLVDTQLPCSGTNSSTPNGEDGSNSCGGGSGGLVKAITASVLSSGVRAAEASVAEECAEAETSTVSGKLLSPRRVPTRHRSTIFTAPVDFGAHFKTTRGRGLAGTIREANQENVPSEGDPSGASRAQGLVEKETSGSRSRGKSTLRGEARERKLSGHGNREAAEAEPGGTESVQDLNLLYSSCEHPDELWLPITEKAYAKFLGSYEALCERSITDILVDLTGGAGEEIRFKDMQKEGPEALWLLLSSCSRAGDIVMVAVAKDRPQSRRAPASVPTGSPSSPTRSPPVTKDNIMLNRPYCILDIVEYEALRLVRLLNPWGQPLWKGEFADYHRIWSKYPGRPYHPADLKDRLNYRFGQESGTFWMKYEDFAQVFSSLQLCYLFDSLAEASTVRANVRTLPNNAQQVQIDPANARNGKATSASDPTCNEYIFKFQHINEWRGKTLVGLPRCWAAAPASRAQAPTGPLSSKSLGDAVSIADAAVSERALAAMTAQTMQDRGWSGVPRGIVQKGAAAPAQMPPSTASAKTAGGPQMLIPPEGDREHISTVGSATKRDASQQRRTRAGRGTDAAEPLRTTLGPAASSRLLSRFTNHSFATQEPLDEPDCSWINAPMYLITLPTPAQAAAAFAASSPNSPPDGSGSFHSPRRSCGTTLREKVVTSRRTSKKSEKTVPEAQLFISLMQAPGEDTAGAPPPLVPISFALFDAPRPPYRLWECDESRCILRAKPPPAKTDTPEAASQAGGHGAEFTPLDTPGKSGNIRREVTAHCRLSTSGYRCSESKTNWALSLGSKAPACDMSDKEAAGGADASGRLFGAAAGNPDAACSQTDGERGLAKDWKPSGRKLLLVCYQNQGRLPKNSERPFLLRIFATVPLLVQLLEPPHEEVFSGAWSAFCAGGRLYLETMTNRLVANSSWALNPQYLFYLDAK